jgi:diguanylate cyclase (GGDEF)-like protein
MAAGLSSRAAVSVAVLGCGAYFVSVIPGARSYGGHSGFWENGVYAAVILACGVVCLMRAITGRSDRIAWALIGAGLTSYGAGAVVFYNFVEGLDEIPYPSAADGFWLMLYPLAIVGIGLMVRARTAGSVASMWLDGIVSGLGLVSLSAAFIFPRITENAGGPLAGMIANFMYPSLDLALVATVVGAMATVGAWREPSWLLLGAGFVVFAGSDSVYLLQVIGNSYQPGSLVDGSYLLGSVLVALAAYRSNRDDGAVPAPVRSQSRSFLIPACFTLAAIAVLVIGAGTDISNLGTVLAAVALFAAWARTGLAVREVVGLSDSRRQARTDTLTGLPNRRAFYELLERAEAGRAAGRSAAVLLIDLDRFKEINDALGHQVGDEVLRAVSRRFATAVPDGGTIARLGGDEIALLLPGMDTAEAGKLAQQLLDLLAEPFDIQDTSLHIDASIGVTAVQPGTGAGRGLAEADLAMYRAKRARTGWEVYDDDRDGDAWDRIATVEALRAALTDGAGLSVEFQPIVTSAGQQPLGVEALVRWNHPTRGRVAPDAFLPLAERSGLMPMLTRRVLDLSLDEALELRRQSRKIAVSVNLSASDLLDTQLGDYVAEALLSRGLPGQALRIEITESLLVEGAGSAAFLQRLRGLGIRLAVDDYGTGYSSLAYLHDLPVSYLKIDRGFTDRLLRDERTAIIVASTIEMAHRLKLEVVAEGVETDPQQAWLLAHGCDLLQGYLIGRPMTADRLHTWLAERPEPVPPPAPVGQRFIRPLRVPMGHAP